MQRIIVVAFKTYRRGMAVAQAVWQAMSLGILPGSVTKFSAKRAHAVMLTLKANKIRILDAFGCDSYRSRQLTAESLVNGKRHAG